MSKRVFYLLLGLVLLSGSVMASVGLDIVTDPNYNDEYAALVIETQDTTNIGTQGSIQITAIGKYFSGHEEEVTSDVTWTNTDNSIGLINNNGIFAALAVGQTKISAEINGIKSNLLIINVTDEEEQASNDTYTVSGYVYDSTNTALSQVTVQFNSSSAVTDNNGYYNIILTEGAKTIKVNTSSPNRPGSVPEDIVTLYESQDINSDVTLNLTLPQTVTVSGTIKDSSDNNVSGITASIQSTNTSFSNTMVTGNDGKYSFNVFPGDYRVSIESSSYSNLGFKQTVFNSSVDNNTSIPTTLDSPKTLTAIVKDDNSNLLANVSVTVTNSDNSSNTSLTTDSNGEISILLYPGNYSVAAQTPDNTLYTDASQDITLSDNASIELELSSKYKVSGYVRDKNSQGIENVSIKCGSENALSDNTGYYELYTIAGTYDITITTSSANGIPSVSNLTYSEDVEITGYLSLNVSIDNYSTLTGTVRDKETSAALQNIQVSAVSSNSAYNSSTVTDNNGNFSMVLFNSDYDVSAVENSDYFGSSQNIDLTQATNISFDLDKKIELSGTVYNHDGSTASGVQVILSTDINNNSFSTSSGQDGSYSVKTTDGTYYLKAGNNNTVILISSNYNITSDAVKDITLPASYQISGTVTDPASVEIENAAVSITGTETLEDNILSSNITLTTNSSGQYTGTIYGSNYNLTVSGPVGSIYLDTSLSDLSLHGNVTQDFVLLKDLYIFSSDLYPAQDFQGYPLEDGYIQLNWEKSPSLSVGSYNIYKDNSLSQGIIDYSNAYSTVISTDAETYSIQVGPFTKDEFITFGLRASDTEGNEEKNITNVVKVKPIIQQTVIPKAVITHPKANKKIFSQVLVVQAKLIHGDIDDVKHIRFEYRSFTKSDAGSGWTLMKSFSQSSRMQNPQANGNRLGRYTMVWDLSGRRDGNPKILLGNYEIRAVAVNKDYELDPSPAITVISIVNKRYDYRELKSDTEHIISKKIYKTKTNKLEVFDEDKNVSAVVKVKNNKINKEVEYLSVASSDDPEVEDIIKSKKDKYTRNSKVYNIKIKDDDNEIESDENIDVDITIPIKDEDNDMKDDDTLIDIRKMKLFRVDKTNNRLTEIKSRRIDLGSRTISATIDKPGRYFTAALATGVEIDGKSCFIATAVFGSPVAGEVELLRNFRDKYLLDSDLGVAFLKFYYTNSPKYVSYIENSKVLKTIVWVLLLPVILLAKSIMFLGLPKFLLILVTLSIGTIYLLIKKVKARV